jgi:hypothetical protein
MQLCLEKRYVRVFLTIAFPGVNIDYEHMLIIRESSQTSYGRNSSLMQAVPPYLQAIRIHRLFPGQEGSLPQMR